ncbi:hypothetical protein ASPWEDRAFT_701433 [Aspergillus wentii DTO 134E9]|uniref:AAA+ ATPase domain-containing protein n=1 Tax=Aspergillus wentii DTO 134E9 TaxID=1073089 RepID=A0A1L9R5I8_ASPWE|nr:uncharacterized protein ASPWEDRAFT_701433 [Aspergillus wentii DTO 134E9]OJJ30182.1 hypothetical protein ASPWEDRAFT_701433 [Aspergillus wentii DTO 134E9]
MKYPDGHEEDDATSDNKPEISRPEQGDRDSMVGYYFAARCKRHSPPNSFRRGRNAIEAILDVPRGKNDKDKSTQAGQPAIIHLRDAGQVYNTPRGKKVIKNLRMGVQNVRKSNIPVLIIASCLQKSADDDDDSNSVYSSESGYMWEDPTSGLDRKLLVSSTAQFVFNSPLLPKQQIAIQSEANRLRIKRETRRLTEALRCSLPERVLPDTKPIDLSKYARDGKLPEIDRDRVVKQAVGFVARKGALDMNDLNQILDRAMRLNSKEDGSLAERLEKIKADCNSFEAKLLHCIVDTDKQKVGYDDVIMNQASKDRVKTLVAMSRIQFEATSQELINSTRISGALFHGPPGTGKTQLARAIASDSHATMLNVSPADIKSRWAGETQKSIKAAFSLAKKLSPCIIFIDEVDAVFYRRSSEDEAWQRQALTQFLQEMDGLLTGRDTPLVLGATNRPDDLDDAFSRRLPHKVMFELPGEEERRKILNLFLKKSDLDPSFDMDSLVQSTDGYSGSDLRSLCAEAALIFATEHVNSQQPGDDGVISCKIVLKNDHFTEALRKNDRSSSDWPYESEESSYASEPDTPTRIFKKDLEAVDNLVTSPALQARLHHLSNLILA